MQRHALVCDVLREAQHHRTPYLLETSGRVGVGDGGAGEGKRRTWHEEEAFVKQVVEEYFRDPLPLLHLEEDLADNTLPSPIPTKKSVTADNLFLCASQMEPAPPPPSSSSSLCSTSSVSFEGEGEEGGGGHQAWVPSIDDTTYGDSDDTNSWYTDDSLGYEADVEPSDRDTTGQAWRRWRSAPDVRHQDDVRARCRPHQVPRAAVAAVAAVAAPLGGGDGTDARVRGGLDSGGDNPRVTWRSSGREGEAGDHKGRPECGYQPRKSCSVDEGKLSRLKLGGVRRVRQHHLLQFPQLDVVGGRSCHGTQNNGCERVGGGVGGSVGGGSGSTPHTESHVAPGAGERLEFVNGNYKGGCEGVWWEEVRECVTKSVDSVCEGGDGGCSSVDRVCVGGDGGCSRVDRVCGGSGWGGSSVEDSTTERTHRVLAQGLVVVHSGAAEHQQSIIPNGSELRTALGILREGLASLELGAATTSGDITVPSEQLHKEVGGGSEAVPGEETARGRLPATITPKPTEGGGKVNEEEDLEDQGAKGGSYTQKAPPSVTPENDMNRNIVVIHLSPALPRRPGQEEGSHAPSYPLPPHLSCRKDHPTMEAWHGAPSATCGPLCGSVTVEEKSGGSGFLINSKESENGSGSGGGGGSGSGGVVRKSEECGGESGGVTMRSHECGGSGLAGGNHECGGGGMGKGNRESGGVVRNSQECGGESEVVWGCQECGVVGDSYEYGRSGMKRDSRECEGSVEVRKSLEFGVGLNGVVWNSKECEEGGVVRNSKECGEGGVVTNIKECEEGGVVRNSKECGEGGVVRNSKECGEGGVVWISKECGEVGVVTNIKECGEGGVVRNSKECGEGGVVWNSKECGEASNSQECGGRDGVGNIKQECGGGGGVGSIKQECGGGGVGSNKQECGGGGGVGSIKQECGGGGEVGSNKQECGGGGGVGSNKQECGGGGGVGSNKQEYGMGGPAMSSHERVGSGVAGTSLECGLMEVSGERGVREGSVECVVRRSSSQDTSRRQQRSSLEWRTSMDNLSSSSGTSSCCHSRPKWKSKISSKFIQIPSPGGKGSASSTASSSTRGRVSDFQLHRVQVSTGDDRKFASSAQRSVIQVPVSGGEDSDNTHTLRPARDQGEEDSTGVQKSELILEPPQFRGGRGGKQKQAPSFLSSAFPGSSSSSRTCVSEYFMGTPQPPPPDSPKLLSQEFKMAASGKQVNSNNNKETDQGKKSNKKNKAKSKPKRYFSGILNAFSSAAPRLRGMTSSDGQWESERKESERRENERRESERKESERKESERKESERKESERKESERKESERKESKRKESERKESERKESERKESERKKWSARQVVCGGSSNPPQPPPEPPLPHAPPGTGVQGEGEPPSPQCVDPGPAAASSGGAVRASDAAARATSEILQVRAPTTQDSSTASPEYPPVSDVVPVPSPRPRRARKNTHDSAGSPVAAPTPPTRRIHAEEATTSEAFLNGSKDSSGQHCGSPPASPRACRGRQPDLPSVDRDFRCNPPAAQHTPHLAYENVGFQNQHTFYSTSFSTRVNSTTLGGSEAAAQDPSPSQTRSRSYTRFPDDTSKSHHAAVRSKSAGGVTPDSRVRGQGGTGGSSSSSSSNSNSERTAGEHHAPNTRQGRRGGGNSCREETSSEHCGGAERYDSGAGCHRITPPRNNTETNTDEPMNEARRKIYEEWQRASGGVEGKWSSGGGWGEYVGTPHNRRRRSRPPSLPTTPPQAFRSRKASLSTSGGSLSCSPTRWRRPQTEDTYDDSSGDALREGRLSHSPSAESLASESTSFYYSAVGSSVYERPKSLYDNTARYSFVTCPQFFEPLTPLQEKSDAEMTSLASQEKGNSATNLPRTISGDLNCNVDISLSEGEIKIRVRTDEEDVVSLTSVRGDSESDSDEYDLSSDIKGLEELDKCASPESCRSTSDSDKLSSRSLEEEEEEVEEEEDVFVSVTMGVEGIVHDTPYLAGTDSSTRSSVGSYEACSVGGVGYRDSLSSGGCGGGLCESGLQHATPCWVTTDSDVRSSISSSDYCNKMYYRSAPHHDQEPQPPAYENVTTGAPPDEDEARESSGSRSERRRLSGVWTIDCDGDADEDTSEAEETTVPGDLQKSFTDVTLCDGGDEPRDTPPPRYHEAASATTLEEDFTSEEVEPLSPTPSPQDHAAPTHHLTNRHDDTPSDGEGGKGSGWEQEAWEWQQKAWQHHQQLHQHHLHHLHHHHHRHQSLLADVMSCLSGGGGWGLGGSWCSYPYQQPQVDPPVHHSSTPDCRWTGQVQDDPPYRPTSAASNCNVGKPPPSPLPPSGSHRSRDATSVPRERSRPPTRQRSRSHRRAHSASSRYRVELEIPPHLLTRPRPSSFTSLSTSPPHSPEPLEDLIVQESLLYLARHDPLFPPRLAERKKNEGNELYKAKDYREALKLYTQAIDLCPDCAAYYSNRSACYMMLGKYTEALNDAREAVRLDKSFVKGYLRVAKCNIALGDATAAQSVLRQATELDPANRSIREEVARAQNLIRCQEEVAKATGKADYRTAIYHLDRALELAVGCRTLKITKAEYLVFLHRYPDAQEIVNEILQFDSSNADAIYVRGMCLYYQDNPDAAFHHFQQVLRLAPDHHKARQVYKKAKLLKQKKEEGNEAFKRGSYQEAYTCYTDALAIDPLNRHTNAKLYFNRATVGSKINKVDEAVEDCTAAINLDERYVKAYLRRARCYQQLEKHEEAVRDYEKVTHLDRSQEHKRLLQEAKIQLKRSKRKDYYKILGVNKTATEDEIKKSYRKMALVHHPDRHANASDKDKHEHEVKFKEIGEAYSVLTDGKKRAMYDRGHDLNDPDGSFPHEEFDPNQIFQAFFGGSGGHGGYTFGSHSGGGGGFPQGGFPGSGFSGGSNFPGGFHFQFG